MIKNSRQYRITRTQVERFEESLRALEATLDDRSDELAKLQASAIRGQVEDLRAQLLEYDWLERERPTQLRFDSLSDVARLLIKARLARGMSQRELAELLGMKEQQIQRYEATDFESASFARILEIADALDLSFSGVAEIEQSRLSVTDLFSSLAAVGLDRNLVVKRLVPEYIAGRISNGTPPSDADLRTAAAGIAQVFDWNPEQVWVGGLQISPAAATMANFKLRKGADAGRVVAYAAYAHYIAMLVLKCTAKLPAAAIPTDPAEVRQEIISRNGSLTLPAALEYVFSLGVPVVPFNDPGGFDGACWRSNDRAVIALKQQSRSLSRWTFDLLHEVDHMGKELTESQASYIESGELSDEEWDANAFAGDVMLDGRAEELFALCTTAAGSVPQLKAVVPVIAKQEGVEVDALANYIARRLSFEGHNWWGAAENLQRGSDEEPWRLVRDFLLQHIDLNAITGYDRDLLRRALQG